ncbi:MAG: TetR/AcrR family transcriptional regulator [Acidobacteriota bacterium]|nr:TetR/AcrR family transcriptional regulator [Acidobacteriota bacterium]
MSGNAVAGGSSAGSKAAVKTDKRILRTRDALGNALMELIREKPFDDITVQHVLDRAGVGRSTFYTHYRDKNDLFLSDVEDFFEMMSNLLTRHGAAARRIAPVRELFTHVSEVRELYSAFVVSGKSHDIIELGRGLFARSFDERLALAGSQLPAAQRAAQAHALAGSFFALLDWWRDHGMKEPPSEMDALFHRMVWGDTLSPTPTS